MILVLGPIGLCFRKQPEAGIDVLFGSGGRAL